MSAALEDLDQILKSSLAGLEPSVPNQSFVSKDNVVAIDTSLYEENDGKIKGETVSDSGYSDMSDLPKPKDITEEDLIKVLESEDPTAFRVPMSLGEPHAEIDKSGKGCTAYDVIIHPDFLEKCKQSELFVKFLITISIEGLEEKYSMLLDRNYTMLKNRKFLGTLPEQNIRTQSKPLIMEMGSAGASAPGKPLISEVSSFNSQATKPKGEEPKYSIVQEPPDGHPEFLVAEIQLPKVKTAKSLTLDLGEDRIFLQTRSDIYLLDIYLPFNLIQDECGAQFNRQTKVLTLTMPVVPPCS
ncbi:PIH1 domain-containing protein 1 [Lingula anatina]|uniref:PIH1 domain-containing protein 1 n=1 Tax=Lingula anatina TaxID=7574 RepID=A0A1S3HP92_LINAN|nr:PIH1 domain-containing protein 1 [Lingula anatina]|eukprot:XP_013387850.2 PIH1 domain-containing protein 1 [Lingula anatina]